MSVSSEPIPWDLIHKGFTVYYEKGKAQGAIWALRNTGYIYQQELEQHMAKVKPRIIQLTDDDISLVTQGGDPSLKDKLKVALNEAELDNQALYVRYSPETLQIMRVDRKQLEDAHIKAYVESEEAWVEG